MGAFVNNYFAYRRSRIQPVTYRISTDITTGTIGPNNEFAVQVSVSHANQTHHYPRLAIVNIELVNSAVNDFSEFAFGCQLTNGDKAIMCQADGPDRHNPIQIVTLPTPVRPLEEIDFVCKPFNRGKPYGITLYIETPAAATTTSEIKMSSPVGVDFVKSASLVAFSPEQVEFVRRAIISSVPLGNQFYAAFELLSRTRK